MNRQIRLRRAFVSFHLMLAAIVFVQSVATALSASGYFSGQALNLHMLLLGSIEAALAIVFVLPRSVRAGAAGLIVVFLFASILHLFKGEFPGSLLVYGAGVVFVGLHGAAYSHRTSELPAL